VSAAVNPAVSATVSATSAPAAAPTGPSGASPGVVAVTSGDPSAEEVAAIVAAITVLWPRPGAARAEPQAPERWRFSGRWWAKPVPARRDRPGRYD
jgi:hypothetical protein